MMKLKDGRDELWQWDTGREISIDAECSQVHFGRGIYGRTIDVDVVDGSAKIPDILLQSADDLHCYGYIGSDADGYTKIEKVFKVNKRKKPADYVFTEQDQRTLEQIIKRVENLEEMQDPDAIKKAVDDYLDNNPIQIEEKDPTVPAWAKQPNKPAYTAKEVGALPDNTEIPPPYVLPSAMADNLGGVKAIPATDAMTEYVGIDDDGKLRVPKAESGGTTDHSALLNRDLPDQHPISAITGLEEALANAGGGSGEWKMVKEFTTTEEVAFFETNVNIKDEALIFLIAAPTSTNTANAGTQIEINGKIPERFGHCTGCVYTSQFYTRRIVHIGHLPNGFISYTSGFEYNQIGSAESRWLFMNGNILEASIFSNSLKENGITKIGYVAQNGVFGIGSKIVVYARG